MIQTVCQCFFFLIIYFAWENVCICPGPYTNLCGYNGDEYNFTEVGEGFESVCDCQEVTFCYVVELSQDCITALIRLDVNISLSDQFDCNITALQSGGATVEYEIYNRTGDEFAIKLLTLETGKFRIVCNEVTDVFTPVNSTLWEIISINPSEVVVDSEVKLELTVVKQDNADGIWCFVITPDNDIEVLLASQISDIQVECAGFNPRIPGFFKTFLSSALIHTNFGKGITVKVTSRHPVAQVAEYSSDFESIIIHFDANIEVNSVCSNVFAEESQQSLGEGFECFAKENLLTVKLREQVQYIDNIVIGPDNKICQAGAQGEFCLPSPPANLFLSKPKLPGPNLSLYMKSCSGNEAQKYTVTVTPHKISKYSVRQIQTPQSKSSGKTQRKNLITWRRMREFQRKIPSQAALQMNETEILPIFENLQSLGGMLGVKDAILGSAARVSVLIQSSPTSSRIVAEAVVTFCDPLIKLFRYKWLVDEKEVLQEGKLIILEGLSPGTYLIKCLIVTVNSTEILGQGWSTSEILESKKKVFIIPSEITVGTEDDIFLQAVNLNSYPVSWICRSLDDNKPCITSKNKIVNDVIDLKSVNITIPAGTLPVGGYIWKVENAEGSNTAKVFVRSENTLVMGVDISNVFVKPEKLILHGSVGRARRDCRGWWSSVREMGFSYLHLNTTEDFSVLEVSSGKIPLTITSEMWKDAQQNSQYMLKLQIFCPGNEENQKGSYDYIKVPLVVTNPPRVSPLIVEPSAGKAMITDFAISGGEVDVTNNDRPLTFDWSYVDPCDTEVPIGRGTFGRNFKTYLPPGDITLIARVCDGENTCSIVSSPVISVIQSNEFPVETFQNAQNQIEYLMTRGDTIEALGLAITAFKSLALVAESEVREKMFSAVEKGIKVKLNDFTRVLADPKARKLCSEFLERAAQVAKYFRKGSDIIPFLMEFKNRLNFMT